MTSTKKTNNVKHTSLILVSVVLLSACTTFKQANTDFKNFCNTVVYYNQPKDVRPRVGWSSTCVYCLPTVRCKTGECPNKDL